MIPILSSEAMRGADAKASAVRGSHALVEMAGTAVALHAQRLLRSCYGKRVAAVVGPGLNGADGRIATAWLRSRGARVDLVEWDRLPAQLGPYDLVIDAAFGLGCARPFIAPKVPSGTLVLAVDLPSGVNADTGEILGEPMKADATLALGALKPAHLTGPSSQLVGELLFSGLGIVESFDDGLMEDLDFGSFIAFGSSDHKWKHAIQAFVGSKLMPGAAELVLRGALAGGASMIRLESRDDVAALVNIPPEVVHAKESTTDPRARAVVAGPGLGPDAPTWLKDRLGGVTCPVVLDADGLDRAMVEQLSPRDGSWVLTPHEGEFVRLTGRPLGPNRIDDVRDLARATGCVVLLKGPLTLIASPTGTLRAVTSGTSTLATAGTGDVLAGLIAATIARGHDPLDAAALAAHLHGRAGAQLLPYATASDVAAKITELIHSFSRTRR